MDPPYTAAVLTGVDLDTNTVPGADVVTFWFAGKPQCTGTRLQDLPAGTPPVKGNAFVQLTCTPAEPRQTPTDADDGESGSAALEGRAGSDDTVNVIEAVQTSTEGDALVWTIGLRHSALGASGPEHQPDGGNRPMTRMGAPATTPARPPRPTSPGG